MHVYTIFCFVFFRSKDCVTPFNAVRIYDPSSARIQRMKAAERSVLHMTIGACQQRSISGRKIATVLWEYVHNLMQDDSISIVSDAHRPGHGKCFWQNGRQTTGSGAKANDSHRKDIMNGREHDEKHDETDYFAVTGLADDELRHALRGGDDCYVG